MTGVKRSLTVAPVSLQMEVVLSVRYVLSPAGREEGDAAASSQKEFIS